MSKLNYKKIKKEYRITFNKTYLGDLVMLEDGFYNWFPCKFDGSCISSWVLLDIHNKLEKLNKEWNSIINKEFKK